MTSGTATRQKAPPQDLTDPALYINRELNWLDFNQRVLDQANDVTHPLLERVKFLAIVGSNLDEFFMVRAATLLKKRRAGAEQISVDGLTVDKQLAAIRQRAAILLRDQARCWSDGLRPALAERGIHFADLDQYTDATQRHLAAYFASEVFPILTPLAFDPGHPFPLISNRSKNLAVVIRHKRRTRFARVKVPDTIQRFVPIPNLPHTSGQTFAFLEDVIRLNIGDLFPGINVAGAHLFRIIRDTDLELQEDGAEDLMESVDRTLRQLRHGAPSLLQVEAGMPTRVVNILVENFEVEEDIVMRSSDRLGFADWMALHRLPRPDLKDTPFTPRTLWTRTGHECIFDRIREQDFLVHHPFDSFEAVETFLRDATRDPLVVAIKITLYRIGPNSPLVDLLIEAADAGKQVAALVELKARFDERTNIQWAMRLESAGIHVVYGVENLKTHCKLCLVVRKEADTVRRYAHVATGNYNGATAQIYTDLGLFTADPEIVADVTEVFNSITGYSANRDYEALLVAPVTLRNRLEELVEREIAHATAGRPARIIFKNNAITDPAAIRLLYRASQAGVEVDLIVRGICCLRPGLPGVSDRIRVRSIVGRFLEHSRVYWFANGGDEDLYLGSADLMERNLDRRVETLARVRSTPIVRHIRDVVLDHYLRDNARAYVMRNQVYTPASPDPGDERLAAQERLLELYTSPPADESQA